MPQVTVYIRADDFEKWKALGKKSEFISDALNKGRAYTDIYSKLDPKEVSSNVRPDVQPWTESKQDGEVTLAVPVKKTALPKDNDYCKEHEMDKKFCKFMKHK